MKGIYRISALLFVSSGGVSFCRANSQNNGESYSRNGQKPFFELPPFFRGGATRSGGQNQINNKDDFSSSFEDDKFQSNFPFIPPFGRKSMSSQKQRNLNYRDVLQCTSPQLKWPSGDMSADDDHKDFEDVEEQFYDDLFDADDVVKKLDFKGKLDGNQKLVHSPVVYQYYGRSRARGNNAADSIHFVLLGTNVDHWKTVGQLLASRGFNAMACERLISKDKTKEGDQLQDAPNLVLEILDVLKWNKAVLVGCDREAILAMETAVMLAPDRVAGLVLCGELSEADRLVSESGMEVLDEFLRRILDCPFVIVGAGDSPTLIPGSSAHLAVETDSGSNDKCLILGGGSAPHRTKPEQFAWVLTRFVEERLVPQKKVVISDRTEESKGKSKHDVLRTLNLPFGIDSVVTPEGRLLLGRATAAALFYITMMKIAVVQYGILRATLSGIKSNFDSVAALRKRLFQAIAAFFLNYGYIPRLFKVKNYDEFSKSKDEEGELKEEEGEEEEEDTGIEPKKLKDSVEHEDETMRKEQTIVTDDDIDEQPRSMFKPFFFLDHIVT